MFYHTYLIFVYSFLVSSSLVDPDLFRSPTEIIESRGFSSEEHQLVTDDGYHLTLFRIVNPFAKGQTKPSPVLLWHGIQANCQIWTIYNRGHIDTEGVYSERNGTHVVDCGRSVGSNLAFTLSACGYDVWLGNSRATKYSAKHQHFSRFSPEYWNFTLTELALFDLKKSIEYILSTTNKPSLSYIGHSMGTTQMFILLSLVPSFERNVNLFIALSPIVFIGEVTSIVRLGVPFVPLVNDIIIGVGTPYYVNALLSLPIPGLELIHYWIRGLFAGPDPALLQQNATPLMGPTIDMMASKVLFQFSQWIASGRCAQFDYMDAGKNLLVYGQETAPDYPIENIRLKNIILVVGRSDYYLQPNDISKLVFTLKVNQDQIFIVPSKYYNHNSYSATWLNYVHVNPMIFTQLERVNSIFK